MELQNQKKLAGHIFRLLKVNEIIIPIGRTNKGNLGIKFSQNSEDYEIMLDSIPLSVKDFLQDDNNIELKKMLDKYLFDAHFKWTGTIQPQNQPEDTIMVPLTTRDDWDNLKMPDAPTRLLHNLNGKTETTPIEEMDKVIAQMPKRRGRPAGAKNRIKA